MANPPGNPRILYIFGEDDRYEPDKARQVWRHFYPEEPAQEGIWPADAPDQKKYFITVPGFGHPPSAPTVLKWDGFWLLIESFFASNSNNT